MLEVEGQGHSKVSAGVHLMGLKPNPWDLSYFQCFDIVGWVI